MKHKEKTELERLIEDYHIAHDNLLAAQSFFNNAESDYIELAVEQLDIAEQSYNLIFKRLKLLKARINNPFYASASPC